MPRIPVRGQGVAAQANAAAMPSIGKYRNRALARSGPISGMTRKTPAQHAAARPRETTMCCQRALAAPRAHARATTTRAMVTRPTMGTASAYAWGLIGAAIRAAAAPIALPITRGILVSNGLYDGTAEPKTKYRCIAYRPESPPNRAAAIAASRAAFYARHRGWSSQVTATTANGSMIALSLEASARTPEVSPATSQRQSCSLRQRRTAVRAPSAMRAES